MTTGLMPEFALLVTNLYAPAGTSIPMAQATAPLGWTSSAQTDVALRYNSGTGGATGGSAGWSGWNGGGTFNLNAFTLSTAQLPAHSHGINDPGHSHTDSGHQHQAQGNAGFLIGGVGNNFGGGASTFSTGNLTNSATANIQSSTTGISTQNTGTGATITPTITTPLVKYVDHILAVKS